MTDYWKAQCEEQALLVQTLQEELEYERSRSEAIEAGEDYEPSKKSSTLSTQISKSPSSGWEWKEWMDRSWSKIWERDISGLQTEACKIMFNLSRYLIFHCTRVKHLPDSNLPLQK